LTPARDRGFVQRLLTDGTHSAIRLVHPLSSPSSLASCRLDALVLADRRKDEFLAVLSHELRSPLGAVQNAIAVLRSPRGSDVTVQNGMYELIERQVRQMSLLASGLLDVGRITRGQLQLQHSRIDLLTVLNNAVETAEPEFSRRGQLFTATWAHCSVWVQADASRLEQVFINLLTNASKYTDNGGQITMSVQTQNGYAVVRVKDSGIGISALALPNIFDLFVQVNVASPRSRSGVGVGLALVRSIVDMHGGSVQALSAGPGLGSEFVVRLRTDV
jgi:signal transduction histidine kinase